jgi:hypothetical protein
VPGIDLVTGLHPPGKSVPNEKRILPFSRVARNLNLSAGIKGLEGTGQDVVVVATLSETTWYNYSVGFPGSGAWAEVFNSDVYDNWVNPIVAGNGGGITASGPPVHSHPCKRLRCLCAYVSITLMQPEHLSEPARRGGVGWISGQYVNLTVNGIMVAAYRIRADNAFQRADARRR